MVETVSDKVRRRVIRCIKNSMGLWKMVDVQANRTWRYSQLHIIITALKRIKKLQKTGKRYDSQLRKLEKRNIKMIYS